MHLNAALGAAELLYRIDAIAEVSVELRNEIYWIKTASW